MKKCKLKDGVIAPKNWELNENEIFINRVSLIRDVDWTEWEETDTALGANPSYPCLLPRQLIRCPFCDGKLRVAILYSPEMLSHDSRHLICPDDDCRGYCRDYDALERKGRERLLVRHIANF